MMAFGWCCAPRLSKARRSVLDVVSINPCVSQPNAFHFSRAGSMLSSIGPSANTVTINDGNQRIEFKMAGGHGRLPRRAFLKFTIRRFDEHAAALLARRKPESHSNPLAGPCQASRRSLRPPASYPACSFQTAAVGAISSAIPRLAKPHFARAAQKCDPVVAGRAGICRVRAAFAGLAASYRIFVKIEHGQAHRRYPRLSQVRALASAFGRAACAAQSGRSLAAPRAWVQRIPSCLASFNPDQDHRKC